MSSNDSVTFEHGQDNRPTILVVGGAGYIGSQVVLRALSSTNLKVKVLDRLMYGGTSLYPFFSFGERFEFVYGDVRQVDLDELVKGVDFVVNVAALVGEHICKKYPKDAKEINLTAGLRLAEACERQGVKRYIFASTCSNYGKTDIFVNEEAKVQGLSLYAQTKIETEKFLFSKVPKLNVTVCRFATVYGLASRVRFDLLIHEFIRDAWVDKKVEVYGPAGWRPFVHVDDAARAVLTVCAKHDDLPSKLILNVGSNDQNFQKQTLGNMVGAALPDAKIVLRHEKVDPRSYRVDFSKIARLTGFKCLHRPEAAIEVIVNGLKTGAITQQQLKESVNITQDDPIRKLAGKFTQAKL
eukprot:TRINITY_DN65590_c0_g1_i2.p1 TRINITY_DN65590_c0_g1~~TRINITY_DN65590_c0_g1_i2.p1  ORF type:complete len:354 (-),score=223.76 TRINITY_DN65590_c0_g1_i2:83-1144(-)